MAKIRASRIVRNARRAPDAGLELEIPAVIVFPTFSEGFIDPDYNEK
jgi:hypothetical protein